MITEAQLRDLVKRVLRNYTMGKSIDSDEAKDLYRLYRTVEPNGAIFDAPFSDAPRNFAYIIMRYYNKSQASAVYAIQRFWRQAPDVAQKIVSDVIERVTKDRQRDKDDDNHR